jgi:hypothetical protein
MPQIAVARQRPIGGYVRRFIEPERIVELRFCEEELGND